MTPDGNGQPESAPAAPDQAAESFLGLGTWEWDPRTGQLWWSDGIYRIIGVDRATFEPNLAKIMAMTLEEDRWVHNVDAASGPLPAYSIYFRVRRPDGTIRTLRETGGASPRWSPEAPRVIGTIMDVTDRAALGDALGEPESRTTPSVGTWRWDTATKTFRASPEALQIVGLNANGMVHEQERNLVIHPEDRSRVNRTYEHAKRTGGAFNHRFRILRPSGEVRFIEEDGHPKEPGVFESRITDVTDRTRLERNLVRAQDTAKLGTWEFDPRTNTLWWSEQTYRLLGFEPNETTASTALWLSRVHPEDVEALRRTLETATLRQQAYSIQYRVRLPNGTVRVMLDQGDFIDGLEVGHLMDITERLRIERTLSRAQAIAGFGSWEWNRRNGQNWWSDELYRILGVDAGTWRHTSRRWADLVHHNDRARVMRVHASAATASSSYSVQYHIVRPDGDHRLVLEQAECDADGVYTGVLLDITEHHRAERNLNLAQQIAQVGSWEWSLISEDHWASEQCYRILGLDPQRDRFEKDNWGALVHPDERPSIRAEINRAFAARQPYSCQYRLLRRDGQERTVIESGEPISDERYVGTLIDVTDRVRMEHNFDEAQRIAKLGSWEVDATTRESRWSDQMYRLLGLVPGSVKPCAEVAIAHVHPEDRQRVIDVYEEADRTRAAYSIRYRVIRADNQTRHMLEQCEYGNGRFSGYIMDVSEQLKTQFHLAKAQKIARIGSWEWNPTTDETWISDELYRMFGFDPGEWRYTHDAWVDLIHPDDRDRVVAAYDNVDAASGSLVIQLRMRHADGSYRLYYEHSELNATGTFTGILWDITDLTKAQRNMSHAQRIARIGSWEWDVKRDEHWWSEECYRLLGLDPQTVPATGDVWEALTHPEDVAWTEIEFNDAWRNNKPYSYQYRIIRPDGQVRTVFETGEPVSAGQYAGTVMDITERVKIEHRLAESQRIAKLGSWEWDIASDARWWSEEAYRIYDFEPAAGEISREVWLRKVHPDDLPMVRSIVETLADNPRAFTYRCRIRRTDGTLRTIQVHGEPIADFGPSNRVIAGTTLDITDRESIEAQLQHAQKMEAVGQLTGGIAHDFNNLLGAILGNLDLLMDELDDRHRARTLAGRAVAAAESGAQLIRRLLAFSRKQTLDAQLTDVNELVVNMLDLLRRTLGDKVSIETEMAGGPILCLIDRPQTEGALLNLCINARDAMPEGGTVTIRTRTVVFDERRPVGLHELQPGPHLELAVADTGTGMPSAVLERAFEPFFTTKAPGQGSGLGLSMVYGFVKQSDGHIEIQSEPGHGTLVRIYLPMHVGAAVAIEAQPPLPTPSRGKEVILVVEDNADLRGYAVSAVRSFGYRALSAPCARTAMKLLETRPDIALLFTDIVFKEGPSGIQLADLARRRRPELRVLLTSGYLGDRAVRERADLSGTFTIAKPFRAADLGRKLAEIFGSERATFPEPVS